MTNFENVTETPKELANFLARVSRDLLATVVEDGGQVPQKEYDVENSDVWLDWLEKNIS